jgi:hypothetical protein
MIHEAAAIWNVESQTCVINALFGPHPSFRPCPMLIEKGQPRSGGAWLTLAATAEIEPPADQLLSVKQTSLPRSEALLIGNGRGRIVWLGLRSARRKLTRLVSNL